MPLTSGNLPEQLAGRDTERIRTYASNLSFYNGEQWVRPSARLTRSGQRRLTMNYAAAFVTKATSYMMQDLTFVSDPVDDTPAAAEQSNAAELAIRQVAEQNALDALDFDTELDCAVLGDAAYKVTWDTAANRVRVTAPDVAGLYVWRRPDDPSEIWRIAQRYELAAQDALDLYGVRSRHAKAVIIEEWADDAFRLWVDGEPQPALTNPYGWIPYIVYPNIRQPKAAWGTSDIDTIREAAVEFNRVVTQLSLIIELSGNPIAVLENVTESTDISVQPGAVWELPREAKAYLLDLMKDGGAKLIMDHADLVRRVMHDLAESPATAFGENDRALSGVALTIALDPLVKKIGRKRLIRSRVFIDRNAMILSLLNRFAGLDDATASQTVRPQWGNVLPNDRSADVADEVALVNAGTHSRRRSAANLGVEDPDAEFERWLEEAERVTAVQPTQTPTPQAGNRGRI